MNYREINAVSASALKKFETSPKLYHDIVTGQAKSVTTEALSFGSLVHDLVLTPEVARNKYVIASVNKPTGQMGDLCDALFKNCLWDELADKDDVWQRSYDEVGFKQKKLETIKEDFKTKGQPYYDLLLESRGKILVSQEEYNNALAYKNRLMTHRGALAFLFQKDEDFEDFNELEILWKWRDLDSKSMLDRVKINHKDKVIKLIDLKTTSKPVYGKQLLRETNPYLNRFTGFLSDMIYYDYLLQMEFYRQALRSKYIEYDIEVYVIPINDFQCTVYQIPERWLYYAKMKLDRMRSEIQFHLDTNQWELSKDDYYHGFICLNEIML